MNPYTVLGVSANATDQEIKSAYRRLVKRYHPDRQSPEASHEQIAQINAAYDLLSDPVRRAQYDRKTTTRSANVRSPQPEDPIEAYKREFKRKRWEREKQERAKKQARRETTYRILRWLHMPIFLFAFGLILYDLTTPDRLAFFHLMLLVFSAYICYKRRYSPYAYQMMRATLFLLVMILLALWGKS